MNPTEQRPPRGRRYTCAICGPFSGTNASVLPAIAAELPSLEPAELDVAAWIRREPVALGEAALSALRERGPAAITSRQGMRRELYRSAGLTRRLRHKMEKLTAARPHAFTLQTQSIFDASVSGLPHFVYTDHTALTNSYYPDFDPASVSPREFQREREIYRHARLVFTMGSHVSRSLHEHYGIEPEKIRTVGAGANVAGPATIDDSRRRPGRILFVGREWGRKGGPQLLEALALLRRDRPEAHLVVAGCSPGVEAEGVEVRGELSHAEVAALYRDASVFCMPTRNEPFGLVYVEALLFGLPVVATDLGAIPDIVDEGESGLLVPLDDPEALAAALRRVLDDPSWGRELGERGRERMRERFSWPAVGAAIAGDIREEIGKDGVEV